jgi:DNA topoisomerase-3
VVDRYHSSGRVIEQYGWKVLEPLSPAQTGRPLAGPEQLPAGLTPDLAVTVKNAEILKKQTRPPPHFADASLLTAMETAGRTLDDKELSDAMKENGLGTPATRAEIIENLIRRAYLLREKKNLRATDKGIQLIETVHPEVKSPLMTGRWEARLRHIQRGAAQLDEFIRDVENYVRRVIADIFSISAQTDELSQVNSYENADAYNSATNSATAAVAATGLNTGSGAALTAVAKPAERPAIPADKLAGLLRSAFGLQQFRPYQEAVCRAVTEGKDVLLVMPTGAGKSLCYQLPGIARAGTTLVISPLIALMEDQVGKLQAQGFRTRRWPNGRTSPPGARSSAWC